MDWDVYYERVFDWAESTRVKRTYELSQVGEHHEVVDALLSFEDDTNAAKLAKKAMSLGVRFTSEEVCECIGVVEWDTLTAMADSATTVFSNDELEQIYGCIDGDVYENLENLAPKQYQNPRRDENDIKTSNSKIKFSATSTPKVSKTELKRLFSSLKSINRSCKKLLSGPPTIKQQIYSQRAKARRKRPWWDK